MKKTIQINISGIVFHIEEDAFDTLNAYLNSIKKYFSTYDGSEEIVTDIEARIAEKFLGKNNTDSTPIVGLEEVQKVMASMGTVADFEAIEVEEEDAYAPNPVKEEIPKSTERKRIYRDGQRKALGGVLSGLANYFAVDVVWFRVIFLIAAFGLMDSGIGPAFFLAYIICWIAFPVSKELEEQENIKKFYRNGENKVIAGVSSGLASYFDLDVAVIRVGFVLGMLFFGVGIIAYLVLWIASPIAESITQKMQMKGEAVTIENIDTKIKQNLTDEGSSSLTRKNENALTTILLLPFRIISKIFVALGQVLGKLGPFFRVLLGLVPLFMGLGFLIASVVGTIVYFAATTGNGWFIDDRNFEIFAHEFPPMGGIFLFLSAALPAIGLFLLGLSLIRDKRIGDSNFWITGLGLWIIGVIGLAIIGGTYGMNYAKEATSRTTETYNLSSNTIYLDSFDYDDHKGFDIHSRVSIAKSEDGKVYLEKKLSARGRSRENAKENAEQIDLNITQNDSTLVFDERIRLKEGAKFRGQEVELTLFIPEGKKIKMSNGFAREVLENNWELSNKYGIDGDDYDNLTFFINTDGDLECQECDLLDEDTRKAMDERRHDYRNDDEEDFEPRQYYTNKEFDLEDFNGIEVGGAFHILIHQGDEYQVKFMAERERDIEDLKVRKDGKVLEVDFEDRFHRNRGKVIAHITMPKLEYLNAGGATNIKVISFEDINNLDLELNGATKAKLDIEAKNVRLDANGASNLEIRGHVNKIEMELTGASYFNGKRAKINRAVVEASGASEAEFGKVEDLDSNTSGASHVNRD
jgi:phage shock protein PspC (stress-responsive transcriptional regulator)